MKTHVFRNAMESTESLLVLEVVRKACFRQALHGQLRINGENVCDTLENVSSCTEVGTYVMGGNGVRKLFTSANGPFTLPRGAISVGRWQYLGFLIKTTDEYDALEERLRISLHRGHLVKLIISRDAHFFRVG